MTAAGRALLFPRTAAATTLTDCCNALTEELVDAGCELPSVYLLVDGRLRCQSARGYYQVVDGFEPGVGVIGRVVQLDQDVVIEDVASTPHFIAAVADVVAEACSPVHLAGAVVGAINVETRAGLPRNVFGLLHEAAAALGEWLERHGGLPVVPLSQRLAHVSVRLASTSDSQEITDIAARGAAHLSGMCTGVIARRQSDGSWQRRIAGPLAAGLGNWGDAAYETMAGWVSAGTSSHFPGGSCAPAGYEFLQVPGLETLTVQPLVAGGEPFGLLISAGSVALPHDPNVGAALELLAALTAAALGMAAAMTQLRIRAVQDPLTLLPNAAAFAQDLKHAAAPSEDEAEQTGLLLIDVDHFKLVNDTFGHLAGDRLLVALADELALELRGGDKVYRIGGDEFAALVKVNETSVVSVADRVVSAARRVRCTVSVGATVIDRHALAARAAADAALYRAKADGRDRAYTAECHTSTWSDSSR